MKNNILVMFMIIILISSSAGFGDNPVVETIKKYVYGSDENDKREAEARQTIENAKNIVKETIDGEPIFLWALNLVGLEGELGVKAKKITEWLLARGTDVNAKDTDGYPYLTKFAMFARLGPMIILLKNGANPDAVDRDDSRTALHWVALLQELDSDSTEIARAVSAAQLLIDSGAEVDARDLRGQTPLHSAAFLGNLHLSRILIAEKADVNAIDKQGYSVLGQVMSRKTETWATDAEKAALEPVIELLKQNGARDIQPQ